MTEAEQLAMWLELAAWLCGLAGAGLFGWSMWVAWVRR